MTPNKAFRIKYKRSLRGFRNKIVAIYRNVCQKCGQRNKRTSTNHHIFNILNNKDLAFATFNGVCLCSKCHEKFHKQFGNGTEVDFAEFITENINLETLFLTKN